MKAHRRVLVAVLGRGGGMGRKGEAWNRKGEGQKNWKGVEQGKRGV